MKKILYTLAMLLNLGSTLWIEQVAAENVLYPNWTPLSQGSSTGYTLSSGHYYVTESITFSNDRCQSGLTIASGATVYLYIPQGVTLTATGGNASGVTGAGAGIELPQNSTLYLMGKGKVVARGGNAANGSNGYNGGDSYFEYDEYCQPGGGGAGGNGGGGAGAGIGTRGGTGGIGASGPDPNRGEKEGINEGVDGKPGGTGYGAASMGTLYVDNTFGLDLTASGGSQGTAGSGGGAGCCAAEDPYNQYSASGGGGGGGGGFGGAAYAIGTGGAGGGGGGSGAAGNSNWAANVYNYFHTVGAKGGAGGKNGNGSTNAGGGQDNELTNPHDACYKEGLNDTYKSGSYQSGHGRHDGGSGGGCGTATTGMSVANLYSYTLNLNVMTQVSGSVQKTKTVTYNSNKSSGNVTVTIPTTYQLGLIESDKYVTKWYTNNGCTGEGKAAYDEMEISKGTTDLYGVWQNYTDLFDKGTGTQGNPFIIEDDGLLDFANYVNDGGNTRGIYFKQKGEIDVSVIQPGGDWTPIGHKRVFEGDYDGDGNRIIKATNTSCNYDAIGIFGKVSGSIHNLGVEECNLQTNISNSRGAAIAGMLLRCDMEQATTAQMRDCYVAKDTITATYTGGLVGEMTNASIISYALESRSTLTGNMAGIASLIGNDCQVDKCFTTNPLSGNGYNQQTNSESNIAADRMQSGAITWLLNDQSPYGGVWFQTLGTDEYPVLNNQHQRVFKDGQNYSNTGNGPLFTNLSGLGTADKPFLINNVSDFEVVASFCNSGNNSSGFYFLQTADFDLNGGGLTPIGTPQAFAGTYDGGGHTIRNGHIETDGVVGIFAVVSGTVTRLCVENTTVKYRNDGMRAGGIAARITGNGVISNCLVKGCTIANNGLSGVVGGIASDMFDQAVIKNCLVVNTSLTATRTGSICSDTKAGTRIERCYSDSSPRVSEAYGSFDKCETVGSDALESGDICWSLNNEVESLSPVWFQNITIEGHNDATPVLSPDHAIVFYSNGCTNDYRGISSLATNNQVPAGTQQNPYRVGSAADLKKICDTFEAMRYSNFYILQTADIDMKEAEPIVPIGIGTSGFTGHYDGGGYVIKNLSLTDCKGITRENIYDTETKSLGLFNNIIGTVERLGIETSTFTIDANVNNINRVGAFAGKITGSGLLLNCYAVGSTVSYNYKSGVVVGALVGELTDHANIQRSYGYKNTVVGENNGGSKRYGYIVGDIGSNASATLVFTDGSTLCADNQSGFSNITNYEVSVADLRFNTGELTHLLDGSPEYDGTQGSGTSIWRQNINKTPDAQTDLVPVLKSTHSSVYKVTYETQTLYTNSYEVPELVTLSLNPNYKDNKGDDMPAVPVSVFKDDDKYYVPGYLLGPNAPSRNYFYFTGWNTQADGKGTHYAPNGEIKAFKESKTLYAEWDMSVPSDGTRLDVTLPADKSSFKIYDAAGYNTPYGYGYSGKLTLKAPEDHIIVLTGTVSTEALVSGQACDYMIVRNGGTSGDIMSNDQSTNVDGMGPVFVSTTNGTEKNIGRLATTGREMTIEFYSDSQNNFTGLNLTATVVATTINKLGKGTEDEPFEVETVEDLQTVKNYFQVAQRTDFYIKQIENIDLQGATLAPMAAEGYETFAGHYDGDGYTIKNGTITSDGTQVGFFANVTGTVTRLGMEDITVSYQQDNAQAGAIAGHLGSTGSITYCSLKNIIVANNNHTGGSEGAIVGAMDNTATVTSCLVLNTDKDICGNKTIGPTQYCYTCYTDETTNAFTLKRGEICYLLNNYDTSDDAVWRQKIGTDDVPVINGEAHSEAPIVYFYNEQGHEGCTNEETATLATLRVQDVPFNTFTDHQAFKGSMVRLSDYTPVHDNLQLERWNTDANGTGTHYAPDAMLVLSEQALVLYPQWNIMPLVIPGDGTEQSPYIIDSTDDWNALASNITYFNERFMGYKDKHIRLDADIAVTEMVGGTGNNHDSDPFQGTFNGNNHMLNFTKGTANAPFTEQYCAPFRLIDGATIKDLKVTGHIYTSNSLAAGIVGRVKGTTNITNCHVSTVIHSSVNGNGSHGGFVGRIWSNNHGVNITGCVYDGRLLTTNGTTLCGGFVGWYANSNKVNVTNSLYAPNTNITLAAGETAINNGATFVRSGGTLTNCYYTETMGTAQGTLVYDHTSSGICKKLIAIHGYTMYSPGYSAGGIDANYDLRTAAVSITPTWAVPDNCPALAFGADYTATLNGEDVNAFPIDINEVGSYTLVLTGISDCVGSQTINFSVKGDHVLITLAQTVGTYSDSEDLNFTGSNLKAYIAAGYNKGENQVLLVRVYDVPAGTGIFLRGEAGETYNIPKGTSQSYYVNMLKAKLEAGPIAQTEGSMSNFLLAKVDGVFKFCTPSAIATLGANRAYLQVPTSFITASAREVDIVFDEDATGITTNFTNITNSDEWYDLQGRPIANGQKPTAKGLYIVNGRKTVIK